MSVLLPQEIASIAGGYHGDPFRVLGPHPVPAGGYEIRAFLPGAREAAVVLLEATVPMERRHENGFFVAHFDRKPEMYLLEVTPWTGDRQLVEDPYRFPPLLSEFDLHLFGEGTNFESYNLLGAHLVECEGVPGVRFAVWAPNAEAVFVSGEFNRWDLRSHPMRRREAGVWELFIPALKAGVRYKYYIRSKFAAYRVLKSDPYAFQAEVPPQTASVVTPLAGHEWQDQEWMDRRGRTNWQQQPLNIYEVHLGSWLLGERDRHLTYRELADKLIPYALEMNYTHLELMPILEHPYHGSWGYQVTGFFAPTSRYGSPDDFRYFVDRCHRAGLGVILDWVPGHFPRDQHGLHYFDGTFLYEHADPRRGEHKEWGTMIFNYGRPEVQSFLLSSAMFWLKHFHLDGFRVDAVASMLYLDYNRKEGEWVPNQYGGRENIDAIVFLRRFNELCHTVPGVFTVAEESTSFPGVSRPTYTGGLGFTFKWNMGWMHDMFDYFKADPLYRKGLQQKITFSLMYAFSENFVLPVSHDEVVHGKASLLGKMPGDEWQRFANCRAFLGYMYAHPGKKLLFMGQEFGPYEEWSESRSLPWNLLQFDYHRQLREYVKRLNHLVRTEPALHQVDFHWKGFEWVDFADVENSVIAFVRRGQDEHELLFFICNFTPVVRHGYRTGVPLPGVYDEVLNSDGYEFGGSGVSSGPSVNSEPVESHGRKQSLVLSLPPLAVVGYKWRIPPDLPMPLKFRQAELPTQMLDFSQLLEEEAQEDPELAYALTH